MKVPGWVVVLGLVVLFSGGVAVIGMDAIIKKFADGVEFAEGYHVQGSIPNRLNNPGDLTVDITGTAIGSDGMYMKYATYADGRAALESQIRKAFMGTSRIYKPSMTIREFASHYTTTDQQAWADNVARVLGVSPYTRLQDLLV